MQRGIRPLTSSADPAHIRESIGAVALELDAEEMSAVASAVSAATP
jgi:diketogulonate reductase-like aldo/keto reductase